ncbi:actin-dependent regulator of chromatin subfamily A [Fragilaria crotonensis]|nr:actin-dependent regulator of chromatin subfamily A [Fragilaria crotonensis]
MKEEKLKQIEDRKDQSRAPEDPSSMTGAPGPGGEFLEFPEYDGEEEPMPIKKAFTLFCGSVRKQVKGSLPPEKRKNKELVHRILRERWGAFPTMSSCIGLKWKNGARFDLIGTWHSSRSFDPANYPVGEGPRRRSVSAKLRHGCYCPINSEKTEEFLVKVFFFKLNTLLYPLVRFQTKFHVNAGSMSQQRSFLSLRISRQISTKNRDPGQKGSPLVILTR